MSKAIDKSLLFRSYLAPKHWPLWISIGLLRLISTLPLPIINKIGAALGMLIYRAIPSRRRAARINIKQAFPDFNNDEITLLCKQSFISMGISFLEMGAAWFKNPNELKMVCHIEGKQYLDAAMAKNKGVILLTGHFTTLEIGGLLIGTYVEKYNAVFKKAKDPLFNALMVHYRSKMGNDLIETKNVRGFIRGLKKGHATWFAPDQDFSVQDIVFTPFLGGIASTLTATAKMAKMTGAAVIPFYQVRLENGKGFKLIVFPELENFPSDDIETDSARVNNTLEKMIYDCPQQYLWAHKRFKTQPDGHSSIYHS